MTALPRVPIALLMTIAAAGCVTASDQETNVNSWTVSQPYHHPLSGVGGGAIVGSITVPDNSDVATASLALVTALQNEQLSVRTPGVGVDGAIPPRVRWSTDIAPVAMGVVALHNQKFPLLTLRVAYYGIRYEGMYDTKGNVFRYKISARLYERGALSSWSSVADDRYSGQFFVQRLEDDILSELYRSDHKRP
jgi:hypothetical protein